MNTRFVLQFLSDTSYNFQKDFMFFKLPNMVLNMFIVGDGRIFLCLILVGSLNFMPSLMCCLYLIFLHCARSMENGLSWHISPIPEKP